MLDGIKSNQVPLSTSLSVCESRKGVKIRSSKAALAEACRAPADRLHSRS